MTTKIKRKKSCDKDKAIKKCIDIDFDINLANVSFVDRIEYLDKQIQEIDRASFIHPLTFRSNQTNAHINANLS